MKDDYGLIESGIPPEMVAKLLGNRSRQQIADAMLAASQQGIQSSGPPGSKVSWTQGLAQLMKAYQGRKGIEEADASRQAIADEISKGRQASLERYKQTAYGTPGKPMVMDDFEGAPAMTEGVPGDRRRAVTEAFMDPYMKDSPLPKMDLADLNRDEDRKAQAEQRMMELKLREEAELRRIEADHREKRITREEADRRAAQTREDMIRLAASLRPPPNPVAPTLTTVVDPKDPKRMLSIDARSYQPGGSLGDPGVIGVAGKEPAAAKQAETVDIGRENVSKVVAELRTYYDNLDKNKGITNPDRGTMDNLAAGIRSSTAGQAAGRILGTRDQSDRNNIMQARPLLMQAVMKATGMTSKQLDSNAELKLWLATATDPSLDVKANKAALDRIEQMYGLGAGTLGGSAPADNVPTATGPNGQKLYLRNGQWVPQ